MRLLKRVFSITPYICIFALLSLFIFISVSTGCSNKPNRSIKNIESFTRLYGYVRYFYPGDEAAALDWESFAVYGVKRVENASNLPELKKALEELFLPIAPALVIHESNREPGFSPATITPPDTDGMKLVAWQHLGAGFGQINSVFLSVRINRKTILKGVNNFGNIINQIDAAPYRGKQIKLKAAVKVAEGKGQLWLRVDREKKQMGFFDNMEDHPIELNQWKDYEIRGTVANDATAVVYGCFLKDSGHLWVDDFQIEIRENENSDWTPIFINNPGFEGDREGEAPKGWSARSPGQNHSFQVTSATAEEGGNSVSIKSRTVTIFGPLPDFEPKPEIGEYISKELGSGLSCIMPVALYGSDEYTYPRTDKNRLSQLHSAIKKEISKKLTGDDQYVRLADITIAWNIFQHFYPYFDVVKTDWKASLTGALKDAYRDKTKMDFLKTLRKFTATLDDGHVKVSLRGDDSSTYIAPLKWDLIENKLVITGIYDSTIMGIHVGDIVSELDGVKAETAFNNQVRYISAATEGWKRYRILMKMLVGPKDSKMVLKIERDGKAQQITIPRSLTRMEHYDASNRDIFKYRKIDRDIYYLNLDRISMPEINRLMPELEKARAIICDLRGYPNGNHYLISHFIKEKEDSLWMGIPRVIFPDFERVTYRKYGWHLRPIEPALKAKLVFITNNRAISYAESYMSYIKEFQLATIVGQPTAGTNGNVNTFTLPGDYFVNWTGMRVLKHDGSQHHGVGISPHVRVGRTIKGIRDGRDEFLEKAIEIAKQ